LGFEELLKGMTERWPLILGPLIVLVVLVARRGLYGLALDWDARNTARNTAPSAAPSALPEDAVSSDHGNAPLHTTALVKRPVVCWPPTT